MFEPQGRCPVHQDAPHGVMTNVDDRFWGKDGTFSYARCSKCGTLALDPRPAPDVLGTYYGDYYPKERMERVGRAIKAGRFKRLRMRRLRVVDRMGADVIGPMEQRDMLDVGCGLGHFLGSCKESGAKSVRGLDFDQNCVDFATSIYDMKVDQGELEEQSYADGQFSFVTAWHYLEHVYEPRKTLDEFFRITKPGGACFVEVPAQTPIGWLMGRFWSPLQAPTHLWHFSDGTLKQMFEAAGFVDVRVQRGMQLGEFACSFILLFTKGFMPNVTRKPFSVRWLVVMLLSVLELPWTVLMTLAGYGGLLRVLARRPAEPTGAD